MFSFGIDVGFSAVKALGTARYIFPSVVGTPIPEASYSLAQRADLILGLDDTPLYPLGNTALRFSSYTAGRRDAAWVNSTEWRLLLSGAVCQLCPALSTLDIGLVTGLPVSEWARYHAPLRAAFKNVPYVVRRPRHLPTTIRISEMLVITQPYGTLLDLAIEDSLRLLDNVYTSGLVGIIDIGGNTLNLLATDHLQEIARWTTSNDFGLLNMLDQVRNSLRTHFPNFSPDTHEVSEWLASGSFRYSNIDNDILPWASPFLMPLLDVLVGRIHEVWHEPGRFDKVIITGGGAAAIGSHLIGRIPEFSSIEIAADPRWANVRGYYKLAQRTFGGPHAILEN